MKNAALRLRLRYLLPALYLAACTGNEQKQEPSAGRTAAPPVDSHLFSLLPSSYTGIHFENRLKETPELNVFTYRNFYNGGGVAVGDLNGDGLPEVMLTSNQHGNKLYLNKGHFEFEDVTDEAGVRGKGLWATGVTFADVNSDGLLDIYVCYAGNVAGKQRANELYVNQGLDKNGVPTFKEMAAGYGIADEGPSTQAAWSGRPGSCARRPAQPSPRPASRPISSRWSAPARCSGARSRPKRTRRGRTR